MKFSCLQENIAQGISSVGHIALKSSSLLILNNIHLKSINGSLTLSATNLEAGITHTVRGKIVEDGECLIPARLLLDLVPLLSSGPLSAELIDEGLMIKTENTHTTLRVHPTADFPIIPTVEEAKTQFSIPRTTLTTALSRVITAAGKIENRPQFNGVLLWANGKNVSFVATDGFRLAEAVVELKKSVPEIKVIIPLTTAQEIMRIMSIGDEDDTVEIVVAENQMKVGTSVTTIVSRLIEGEYPDYVPLFPTETTTKGLVEPAQLAKALKATTLFSRAGLASVVIDVHPNDLQVNISSENGDVGAHRTTLPFDGQGENVRVVANARYVLDGISSMSGRIQFLLTNGDRPLLLQPEKADDVKFRYLVMPIRQ